MKILNFSSWNRKGCANLPNKWVNFIFICKFCKKTRCFHEKITQLEIFLHDRRSRQISSLKERTLSYKHKCMWTLPCKYKHTVHQFNIFSSSWVSASWWSNIFIFHFNIVPEINFLVIPDWYWALSFRMPIALNLFWSLFSSPLVFSVASSVVFLLTLLEWQWWWWCS